jgi:RNA polymerase sigma-70 factor (ECF subfamily)
VNEQLLQHIIKGCIRADRGSQEELYKAFFGYGTTLALHYVNNGEEAKAIYNDAMMRVFQNIATFRGEANFKTWLHRIVVRASIDYYRRFYAFRHEPEEHLIEEEKDTQDIENQLFEQDILHLVQQIAPSYRTVFLLHVMEGFTFKEIAEQLGISEGGAKTLQHKAKIKLKILVTTYFLNNGR